MLPVQFRLKDKKDFNTVFKKGKAVSNDVLLLKFEKVGMDELKIGFSAGIKFSKKAPERNKAKRWMREAVRSLLGKIEKGYHLVFVINSKFPFEQASFSLVQEKTEDLLKRAKIAK